jgi:hypothetical protein
MALPPLETPEEVQICIGAVFTAIAENRIDNETRRTLIDMLRLASRNLRTAALIRHFAAREARLAKKQQLESQEPNARETNFTPLADSGELTAESASSADDAPLADSREQIADSAEPQEADLELLAQLKSREDDRKAVDHMLANRVWVAPPKPRPKPEVIIPRSPFGDDETQDPSTPALSSESDSGRLRSG